MSLTARETDWFPPLASFTEAGQSPSAIPEPGFGSKHLRCTVGAPVVALYHPVLAGEAGVTEAVMLGARESTVTVAVFGCDVLPA
jgi:hypothetical protein